MSEDKTDEEILAEILFEIDNTPIDELIKSLKHHSGGPVSRMFDYESTPKGDYKFTISDLREKRIHLIKEKAWKELDDLYNTDLHINGHTFKFYDVYGGHTDGGTTFRKVRNL